MSSSHPEIDLPTDHILRQIIDAINANPEVREPLLRALLTEDFLALPKRMDKLENAVEELREETRAGFSAVNARIDNTNAELGSLSGRLDDTNAEVRTLSDRVDSTNAEVRTLSGRLDDTNAEVRTLSDRVDDTNAEVRTLSDRVDGNTRQLNDHTRQLSDNTRQLNDNTRAIRRLEGHVGRLIGSTYEDLCRYEIGVILDGYLFAPVLADRDWVYDKLLEARASGSISRDDYLDGLRPDIIAREKRDTDHVGPLAVVECSISFNRGDLENAARRAAIISGVTGNSVSAFVATERNWPAEVDVFASELGVTIIHHEQPPPTRYEDLPDP